MDISHSQPQMQILMCSIASVCAYAYICLYYLCVLDCVTHCSQSAGHLHVYEHFLQVQQIGFSHWDPYAVRRGGCSGGIQA